MKPIKLELTAEQVNLLKDTLTYEVEITAEGINHMVMPEDIIDSGERLVKLGNILLQIKQSTTLPKQGKK